MKETKVYGVGIKYNENIGKDIFRTAGVMQMQCNLQTLIKNVRENIISRTKDNKNHTLRYMVKDDRFWASDCHHDDICNLVLRIESKHTTDENLAHKLRKNDSRTSLSPVCLCICEAIDDKHSRVSWVFRHDVIDGWRAMRHLFTCAFSNYELTFDRLQQKKQSHNLLCSVKLKQIVMLLSSPLLLPKLYSISKTQKYEKCCQFYLHTVCDLENIKAMGKSIGLNSLSECLTFVFSEAFFAGNKTTTKINVGNAILFDSDAYVGNHMCTKICRVTTKHVESPKRLANMMNSISQKQLDSAIAFLSKKFTQGKCTPKLEKWIEKQQDALDILISSIPCTDTSEPNVEDLTVCREYTKWYPCIVYCLGINGKLYMDAYWQVSESFNESDFIKTLTDRIKPLMCHTSLPEIY